MRRVESVVPKGLFRPKRKYTRDYSVQSDIIRMRVPKYTPGARVTEYGGSNYFSYDVNEESILHAAKNVFESWTNRVNEEKLAAKRDELAASLIGDYPPKKLGQVT